MNNLPEMPGKFVDDTRRLTPHFILNAEVTDGGVLLRRQGYVQAVNLANCHSLAGEESGLSAMLAVADGVLYRIDGATATALTAVSGPAAPLTYAEVNNLIYMSNPYWAAVYDLRNSVVRSWGVPYPPAPALTLIPGDMPPGTYTLAYTQSVNGQLSGNGPLVQVKWDGGTMGIQLENLPDDGQCWITQPNGQELYLANLDGDIVTGQAPQAIPLPSFMVGPPPGFNHFAVAFGRIWGCSGRNFYYSDPFQYEWFQPKNFIPFLENLVMVAPVTMGMFVSSLKSTWFLDGTEPGKMLMKRVGVGAIPGTLTYAEMPAAMAGGAATSSVFATSARMPTPVWMSPTGVAIGTHGGNVTLITEHRLMINPRSQGASLFHQYQGRPQIITSLSGAPSGDPDNEIETINQMGRLFVQAPFEGVAGGLIELSAVAVMG